jgi:Tfp pilus assembly ATPase PilU
VPPCIPESEEPFSGQKGQNLPSSYCLGALESIEDPVEFLFESRLSRFTHLKVGIDTPTFAEGLRRSLRQNPDIIFLGELRDRDSASQI